MFPLISVIIPSYNCAKTVKTAVKSILKQSYPRLEIIIVDDNNLDNTKKVIDKLVKKNKNVKYYRLPHDDPKRFNMYGKNINAGWMARNYGIEKAKGEWVTFQDADDASLNNRIEIQYQMAKKYRSSHVCISWQKFNPRYLGKSLNVKKFLKAKKQADFIISSKEILKLIQKTKGSAFSILGRWHKYIPFIIKKRSVFRSLFFKSWDPYPGAGNSPLVKRKVIKKIEFRPLAERVWPSIKGRGADRDFNFQVAETFKNSVSVKLPLYMWRVKTQHPDYPDNYFKNLLNFLIAGLDILYLKSQKG